jgi:hypothetical protein
MGLLVGYGLIFAGPYVLAIGIPLAVGITYLWTRGRPAQMIGAVALIPISLVILAGWNKVHEFQLSQEAALIQAGLRPEYVSRTIDNPVGKVEHLIWAGTSGWCREECYEILVNGMADRFSYAYIAGGGSSQTSFTGPFSLARLSECTGKDDIVTSSLNYLQSRGIFDRCVASVPPGNETSGILIGGENQDRTRLLRLHGLPWVTVAQHIDDGIPGTEIARWEYGSLPGSRKPLGEPFSIMDFVRAFTGIKTDQFAVLQKLAHSERLDRVLAADRNAHLGLYSVLGFITSAPDAWVFSSVVKKTLQQDMPSQDIAKFRSIAASICAATPNVSRAGNSVECVSAYNHYMRQRYPRQADTLMLPNTALK